MRFACEPYRESGVSILSGVDDIQVGLQLLPPHLGVHELPGDVGRPHPEGADHAQLGVHQALRGGDEGVGGQAYLHAGYPGRLAAVPGELALPRAHLQQRGHHEADAGGGAEVQQGGPDLEEHHGQDRVGHESSASNKSAKHAGE